MRCVNQHTSVPPPQQHDAFRFFRPGHPGRRRCFPRTWRLAARPHRPRPGPPRARDAHRRPAPPPAVVTESQLIKPPFCMLRAVPPRADSGLPWLLRARPDPRQRPADPHGRRHRAGQGRPRKGRRVPRRQQGVECRLVRTGPSRPRPPGPSGPAMRVRRC